jgi:hypothetical protein
MGGSDATVTVLRAPFVGAFTFDGPQEKEQCVAKNHFLVKIVEKLKYC